MRRHQALGERKPKVVRLSELLNVLRLPPNAEACPMENMCAFCVETQERTLVFAALKDDCGEWVEKLCRSTFQKNNVSESNKPLMEENAIYQSADDVSDFRVLVQRTDVSARCGLQGQYWLQVGREALRLRDAQRNEVQEWRYELLRRYGKDKDSLSIETGRRCDCGPGTLIFETPQAETIFSLIQSTIKRKTTHTAPSAGHTLDKTGTLSPPRSRSPLPQTPEKPSLAAIFDNKPKTQDDSDESPTSHPAPITLMPLPSLPTQAQIPKSDIDNVYADPSDCVKPPDISTSLYVDPASVLPLKPPGKKPGSVETVEEEEHSDYAEVFDRLNLKPSVVKMHGLRDDEPIYSEPVTEEKKEEKEEKKEDPFAHLYAQVNKTNKRSPSPKPRTKKKQPPTEQDSDVIYENLGII